jgi:hypothetical protein
MFKRFKNLSIVISYIIAFSLTNSSFIFSQECIVSELPSDLLSDPQAHIISIDINDNYVLYLDIWFDQDVYRYDYNSVINISKADGNNSSNNRNGKLDGERVVWQGNDGQTDHIYLFENNTTVNISSQFQFALTENVLGDANNGEIVWSGIHNNQRHIYSFKNGTITKISGEYGNTSTDNQEPRVENGNIIWTGFDNNNSKHLYLYNINGIQNISAQYNQEILFSREPQIMDDVIVWSGYIEDIQHVFRYSNNQITNISGSFNNNSIHNGGASYSEGRIAWTGYDGETFHIYLFDNNSINKITSHENVEYQDQLISNFRPKLDGKNLTWTSQNRLESYFINTFDGTNINNIYESSFPNGNLESSGENISWTNNVNFSEAVLYIGQSCLTPCSILETENDIPTLNEWMLINLALILLILNVVMLMNHKIITIRTKKVTPYNTRSERS